MRVCEVYFYARCSPSTRGAAHLPVFRTSVTATRIRATACNVRGDRAGACAPTTRYAALRVHRGGWPHGWLHRARPSVTLATHRPQQRWHAPSYTSRGRRACPTPRVAPPVVQRPRGQCGRLRLRLGRAQLPRDRRTTREAKHSDARNNFRAHKARAMMALVRDCLQRKPRGYHHRQLRRAAACAERPRRGQARFVAGLYDKLLGDAHYCLLHAAASAAGVMSAASMLALMLRFFDSVLVTNTPAAFIAMSRAAI